MATILWKNLTLVPPHELEALKGHYDELGHFVAAHIETDVIYVYECSGNVIEICPATHVRLTGDTLQVWNGKEVVGGYPRERVMQASHRIIEPSPLG